MLDTTFIPAEGRTVVFQIAEGQFRPAQIVRAWGQEHSSAVNLLVFLDGSKDNRYSPDQFGTINGWTLWATSRTQGEAVGQWLVRKP
jgi:hypothetical protein